MNDLELGISASGADLYRNSWALYPYNIGSLASITGHNSPWGDPNIIISSIIYNYKKTVCNLPK